MVKCKRALLFSLSFLSRHKRQNKRGQLRIWGFQIRKERDSKETRQLRRPSTSFLFFWDVWYSWGKKSVSSKSCDKFCSTSIFSLFCIPQMQIKIEPLKTHFVSDRHARKRQTASKMGQQKTCLKSISRICVYFNCRLSVERAMGYANHFWLEKGVNVVFFRVSIFTDFSFHLATKIFFFSFSPVALIASFHGNK